MNLHLPVPCRSVLILLLLGSLFSGQRSAFAGMPQPMIILYGQARDPFGWPYARGADVILRAGTNEIVRHTIAGSLAPGVNFALHVPIDDGRTLRSYVYYALTTGAVFSVVVQDGLGEHPILEHGTLPSIPRPGDIVHVNITAGLDSDGDGIPDEWEWELIRWAANPMFRSLADVRPEDDYDGDGRSNGDEYRAGTFAFLDYDFFSAEKFQKAANGRYAIAWLSTPGKVYRIESAPIGPVAGGFDWQACEYALSEAGAWQNGPAEGTGDWMAFYVPPPATGVVWRLVVE